MVENAPNAHPGWVNKVKSMLHLDTIKFSHQQLLEIGILFGVGLILGYLFKRLSLIFLVIIITAVALLLLEQLEFINLSINFDKIKDFIGLHQPMDSNVMSALWSWFKKHMFQVLSFAIGFLIGIRLS